METLVREHYGIQNNEDFQKHVVVLRKQGLDEDAFQCKFCTDLCYFSMIRCAKHTTSPVNSNMDATECPEVQE